MQALRVENILACHASWAGPIYSSATQHVPDTWFVGGDELGG